VIALTVCLGVLVASAQTKSSEELTLFPTSVTMAGDEARVIKVATRSGKIPADVEWSISNPAVATMIAHGSSTADIKALSAGRALVTARVDGRTATATVIVADDLLRLGTIRWAVAPLPGMVPRAVLDATHVDDDGSDLFAVDADPMKRFSVVRALTENGTLVWQATVRGTPWAGDRFGGLLARLGPLDQPSRILARFDRPRSRVPAWRYRARGYIDDFAESDDGTIFLSVQTHPRLTAARDEDGEVVVIDGRSGLEAGHFTLPRSTWQTMGSCVPKSTSARRPSELGSLGEGTNGGVYAEMLVIHDAWTRVCDHGRPMFGRGRFKISRELQLVRLTRKGFTAVRTLWRSNVEGPDTVDRLRALEDVAPGPVAEMKSGELVAMRTHVGLESSGRLSGRLHVARIAHGDVMKEMTSPAVVAGKPWRVLIDGFETMRVYFADGTAVHAMDLSAGTELWSLGTGATPFEAVQNNTVVVNDTTRGQVMEINARGSVVRTFPAHVDDARVVVQGNGIFHAVDSQTRATVEVQGPAYVDSSDFQPLDLDTSFSDVRRRFADFLLETR
jgi:outer membrane protein assembly factor BamB